MKNEKNISQEFLNLFELAKEKLPNLKTFNLNISILQSVNLYLSNFINKEEDMVENEKYNVYNNLKIY